VKVTVTLWPCEHLTTRSLEDVRRYLHDLNRAMLRLAIEQDLAAQAITLPRDEPLWTVEQVMALLKLGRDTIYENGPKWGIEADLNIEEDDRKNHIEGVKKKRETHRYIPAEVRALAERRRR
jgi:hypothetical protein